MELTPKAQISELIRAAQTILLLSHSDPDGDAIASSLALKLVLEKLGKQVDVALHGTLPEQCSFLPGYNQIKQKVEGSSDIIITVDTRQTGEDLKLGQKKLPEEHQLIIVVTPKSGVLTPEDIVVTRSAPKYDLVIFLDCTAGDRIGPDFAELSDLLFETPTVSIDHHATNSYFAKVNWVDMTATATSEMLVSLVESLSRGESLFDADIATCLLTGIMTDTDSFQNPNTTPKALTIAAQLVAAGANQQEIVEKIFKTKPLQTLKLWGKILSNLHEERDGSFVWASISQLEAKAIGSPSTDTGGMIDDLLKTTEGVDFVMLLREDNGTVHGSLRSVNKSFNVAEVAKLFGGGGHIVAAGFEQVGDFLQVTTAIINTTKEFLATKAGRLAN